jgi:hypothetical protein
VSFLYILVVGGGDGCGEVVVASEMIIVIRLTYPNNITCQKKKIEKKKFILAHHVSPACSTIIS